MALSSQTIIDNSHLMIKTASAMAIAGLIDWKYFNRQNWQESAYFGLSAGAGIYLGDMLGGNISAVIPSASNGYISGKTLLQRVAEVAGGTLTATAVNMYVLKNSYNQDEIIMRMAIVAAADVAGEYIGDLATSQPLSYLQ